MPGGETLGLTAKLTYAYLLDKLKGSCSSGKFGAAHFLFRPAPIGVNYMTEGTRKSTGQVNKDFCI